MQRTLVFVHDRIVFEWWAEAILRTLIQEEIKKWWLDSIHAIYVLYSSKDFFTVEGNHIPIVTALPKLLNNCFIFGAKSSIKLFQRLFDYRNLMFFYPQLCRLLRRKILQIAPERVVISSFAAVKNIVSVHHTWFQTIHIFLYLHSPMQYIWENYAEYSKKLQWLKWLLFQCIVGHLRKRDTQPRRYDAVVVNSRYTADCAKKYYWITTTVQYPKLSSVFLQQPFVVIPKNYFVYVGRLVKFIRELDRVIALFNRAKLTLLVLWSGPDEYYLQSIAGNTIVFVGQVNDTGEKANIIANARWLINIAKESCGISTMEALSLGVPVFAYAEGGSVELLQWESKEIRQWENEAIILTQNGIMVKTKENDVLDAWLVVFSEKTRDRKSIQERFRDRITNS